MVGAVVVVGAALGLVVVTRETSVLISSSPRPLQRSVVQMQAEMLSDSRESGSHSARGSTGLSMLPSRMLVAKHSLMTDLSVADFLQE